MLRSQFMKCVMKEMEIMICFRCKKDKEQLLAIDNKELSFKETICFPCVVKCLKDHKRKQADELVKKMMGMES